MLYGLAFMYLMVKNCVLVILAVAILTGYQVDKIATPILIFIIIVIDSGILVSQRRMIDKADVTVDKS